MSDLVELLNDLNQGNRIEYDDYSQLMFCVEKLENENATLKEQLNVAQKGNEQYQRQRNASKQWYLDHKESRKDYYKEYRKNNKEKCKEYRNRYYQTHKTERKEKARQYAKDYYWAHKEEINEKQKHKRMYGTYELFK